MRSGIAAHFGEQAETCRALGSPFTADLLLRLTGGAMEGTRFGARIDGWAGDAKADALALRTAGALHALALSGEAAEFSALYQAGEVPDAALLAGVIRAHDEWLLPWLESPPQTNEVARSGVLLGGLLTIADEVKMPLELLEIGASAGLNLIPEKYRYQLGPHRWGDEAAEPVIACEWRGKRPPLEAELQIVARAGVDLRPVDPALRPSPLLAYLWPDQHERRARMLKALDRLAETGVKVEQGDAAEWVVSRLAKPQEKGRVRVLMHSIMWTYLPDTTRKTIDDAVEAAAARATPDRPLARLFLEGDGDLKSAAVRLRIWPGGEDRLIGRGGFHGRWAEWL